MSRLRFGLLVATRPKYINDKAAGHMTAVQELCAGSGLSSMETCLVALSMKLLYVLASWSMLIVGS